MTELRLHPDRLLPTDPDVRAIARRLYDGIAGLPIVSPHGHVDPRILAEDVAFTDPAALLVTPDHYVTRLLHAQGVPLEQLGLPPTDDPATAAAPREVWRTFCAHWPDLLGTPSRYWLEQVLVEVLGIDVQPTPATADALFDQISETLAAPSHRPRALYDRFNLAVLATTDDPASPLTHHRALAADPSWTGRVVPTMRLDAYLDVAADGWPAAMQRLDEAAGVDVSTYAGFIDALERRRAFFAEQGATATDYSPIDLGSEQLSERAAAQAYASSLDGTADAPTRTALRRHLLSECARMSAEDGLVMQLHPGVVRGHHGPTARRYGPDTGHDIPVALEVTRALRPLLERFGTEPRLRLVLFTVDEDVWSREIAPLAGFYPSVYAGAPWWFLDSPDTLRRFRETVTDTLGFTRTSGFIDDTRAFCSIPARHDVARRVDAGYLAELVAGHRLSEEDAAAVALDLTVALPQRVFRL